MNLYTQIQMTVSDSFAAFLEYSKKRYVKELLMVSGMVVVVASGYSVFRVYKQRQNVQAFAGLVEIAKAYEKALSQAREQESLPAESEKENPWEDTQLLLEALSSAHAGSSLSPFFTLYEAQLALDQDGDFEKACKLMDKGVRGLSRNSVYYDMFNMKRIKMLLDSSDEQVRAKAVQELEKVAYDAKNYYAQEALYTLGSYQAFYGNMPEAINAWVQLAQEDCQGSLIASPWVTQAQEKLKTLNISLPTRN